MVTLPGEKLAVKIIETLEKGVGALARPWQIIREGKARAEAIKLEKLAIAEAEVEAEEIRQGRKALVNGELLALPAPTEPSGSGDGGDETMGFLTAAKAEADYLTVKRAINLRKITIIAEEEAGETPDEEVFDNPVDPDWFARWREAAQDVSNEEMQQLWARLLSGEVKKPGSFSLQTVILLRTLSSEQANQIAKLGPFVIKDWIFKDCNDLLENEGLSLNTLLELEGLGIVTGLDVPGLVHDISFNPDPKDGTKSVAIFASGGTGLLVTHPNPVPAVQLRIYKMLKPGKELILLGKFQLREDYLTKLAKFFKDKGFETFIVDVTPVNDKQVRYSNPRPIN